MSESERYGGRRLAAELGRVSVWSWALQRLSAADASATLAALEGMGFGTTWIPETLNNKEIFSQSAILLAGSERMVIATGIANIQARDPMAMANGGRAIAEAFPGRFVLGLGVSHANSTLKRGGTYEKPLTRMREYLDAMDETPYGAPQGDTPLPIMLAALGPRMLELAAERTDGAHPYFVPVEHTAFARERMGPEPFLSVEQTVVLDPDPTTARGIGRGFAKTYLAQPNYANNLRRLGWSDQDLAGEGSDRLIDAVIAWGDVEAIARRVREHLDAGADQVGIQVRMDAIDDTALGAHRELAAALIEA